MKALVEQIKGFIQLLWMSDAWACMMPYFGNKWGHLEQPKAVLEGSAEFQKYFSKVVPK